MKKNQKDTKIIMYGTCNIENLVEHNAYIMDRSHFIEKIEQLSSKHLFFYRPRLFGKSAFLSVLTHYYDTREKNKFKQIFGKLYIGKNPTPLRNSYPLLHLSIGSLSGDMPIESVENSFHYRLKLDIRRFFWQYPDLVGGEQAFEQEFAPLQDSNEVLELFLKKIEELNIKIYLIFEDYDTFPNHMITHYSMENYRKITSKGGFLRKTFDLLISAIKSGTIDRTFGIGLMPQVLHDLTDGEGPFVNISRSPEFYNMGGFTEPEVLEIVDDFIQKGAISEDIRTQVLETMKTYYGGFLFSPDPTKIMYNPMSVFHFLGHYRTKSESQKYELPFRLIDSNLKSDFDRIRLFTLEEDNTLNINFNALLEALLNGQFKGKLLEVLGNDRTDPNWFMSFLYYRGFITVKTEENGDHLFMVPNKVCSTFLWDYLDRIMHEAFYVLREKQEYYDLDRGMMSKHIWQPLFEIVLKILYQKVDVKYFIQNNISILEILCHCFKQWYTFKASPQQNFNGETIGIHLISYHSSVYTSHYLIQIKCLKDSELNEKQKAQQIQKFKTTSSRQLKHGAQDPKLLEWPVKLITIVLGENEPLLLK